MSYVRESFGPALGQLIANNPKKIEGHPICNESGNRVGTVDRVWVDDETNQLLLVIRMIDGSFEKVNLGFRVVPSFIEEKQD